MESIMWISRSINLLFLILLILTFIMMQLKKYTISKIILLIVIVLHCVANWNTMLSLIFYLINQGIR